MKVLNIPNIITFIRIVIIPVFVTALIYRRYDYALFLFIAAAVSDALDGLLARITKQKTKLGAFLDPLADKSLLVTSFVLFSVYGWIPMWLTIIVISRDLIVSYLPYNKSRADIHRQSGDRLSAYTHCLHFAFGQYGFHPVSGERDVFNCRGAHCCVRIAIYLQGIKAGK